MNIAPRTHWTPGQLDDLKTEIDALAKKAIDTADRADLLPPRERLGLRATAEEIMREAQHKAQLLAWLRANDGDATGWPGPG